MKQYECLIVDDEELARNLLVEYISRVPFLQVAGSCKNPMEAMSVLATEEIHIIFLDIRMPGISGIDFIKTIKRDMPIVMTTAYSEYAIEAFDLNVLDYLLKPYDFNRFLQAVQKFQVAIGPSKQPYLDSSVITSEQILLVKSEHKIHRLPYDEILYLEGMKEYVAVHILDGKRMLTLSSLKSMEEELRSADFVRAHKSYIVNGRYARMLDGKFIIVGEQKIPVGAVYREVLVNQLFT